MPHPLFLQNFLWCIVRVLTLDLSTSTGYAVLERKKKDPVLVAYGTIKLGSSMHEFGDKKYPWTYVHAAHQIAQQIVDVFDKYSLDKIIIEETNGSRSRYTQKALEFIHFAVLDRLGRLACAIPEVIYVNTGDWRRILGIVMDKDSKKLNAKLARAKRKATECGEKLDKKELGIRGRINRKHLTIRFVNEKYPKLKLKTKDDDIADAIALGLAYFAGVSHCDGKK